ncbi:Pectinesterase [Quillaja saponaria]|uniref:Pectinesterase n=1 Tax=Quillaja saponaria TaxID=32244 RepID=A0AAD7LEC5_QUISA|nr:Pectinesterase [Quillaja saponaria]
MVEFAIDRALNSHRDAKEYGQNCVTNYQKVALADCLKLYDNTILQLNRTLHGLNNQSISIFDAQTWLSTALTNIETCRTGSLELNVSDFITPIMGNNVSELICNCLAINGGLLKIQEVKNEAKEFPSWVSKHERRLLQISSIKANLVVAKDGSGRFKTVQAAIDLAARRRGTGRFVIYVKKGIYRENIEVDKNNNNIMLVGDGLGYTIITSSRSVQGGSTTYNSATAGIDGLYFIARGITFRNTAGPLKGQAVALRSASDLSVFYRCAFQGYQDTLIVHSQRQFYRECNIYGTIDFIFGNAACAIYVRRPLKGQANVVTAQARNDPFQNTGISNHNSQIRAANDLKPVVRAFKTYLGRPWMQYSRTVVMKTYLDSLVSALGWDQWLKTDFAVKTVYYGESKNFGPGSSTRLRVRWPGFHIITSPNVASHFTVNSLLAGPTWLSTTGVPFASGL